MNAEDSLKKFFGLPPYGGPTNVVRDDPYYWASLQTKFPRDELERAAKKLGKKLPAVRNSTPPIL